MKTPSLQLLYRFGWILLLLSVELLADVSSVSGNIHFKVNTNTLMTLGTQGLGIGTSTPSSNLQVQGNAIVTQSLAIGRSSSGSSNLHLQGSLGFSVYSTSGNETLTNLHSMILAGNTSGNTTLIMPYAGNMTGTMVTIKNTVSASDVYLESDSSPFDEDAFLKLPGSSLSSTSLMASGNRWHIIHKIGTVSAAPLSILSNLIHWWDGNDIDGDGIAEGASESGLNSGNVSDWMDKGSFSANLYQTSLANMPKLKVGLINGKSCPEFDADFLLNQGTYNWNGGEAFVVVYHSGGGPADSRIISQEPSNGRSMIARNTVNTSTNSLTYNASDNNKFPGGDANNVTVNGVTGVSGNTLRWEIVHMTRGSTLNSRLGIQMSGRNQAANDRDFEGYIAEVMIFNSLLSDIRRRQIEAHLKAKWGISY